MKRKVLKMFLPRVEAGRGKAKPMAAASHLCSLMLNPSGVRLVLAQLAPLLASWSWWLPWVSLPIPPTPCCLVQLLPRAALPQHGAAGQGMAGGGILSSVIKYLKHLCGV